MNHKVYVLYSKLHNKLYIGYTSNLFNRLNHHNHKGVKGWTIRYRPWILIHIEEFIAKKEAMNREKALKSGKGREYIRQKILPYYL